MEYHAKRGGHSNVELQQCLVPGYRALRCAMMLLIRVANRIVTQLTFE